MKQKNGTRGKGNFKGLGHYQWKYLILIHTNSQWLNQAKRGDKCKSSHLNMLLSQLLLYNSNPWLSNFKLIVLPSKRRT